MAKNLGPVVQASPKTTSNFSSNYPLLMKHIISLFCTITLLSSCKFNSKDISALPLDASKFDTLLYNKEVKLYTLNNKKITAQITNYGGRLLTLIVPDKNGVRRNINWREKNIKDVLESPYIYSGPIIGRSANLTDNGGLVTIAGKQYQLSVNASNVHNAGGVTGLSFSVWDAKESVNDKGDPTLKLTFLSEDGHEGYPGNAHITATYTLTKDALVLNMKATTDAPTFMNLTHHPFFNLHGSKNISTNSHLLTVYADNYTPAGESGPLTGEIAAVEGTPFDFRTARTIGERVNDLHPQLQRRDGYDVNFMINDSDNKIKKIAELYEPQTGIAVEIISNQPAMQLYGGPFQGKKTFETRSDPRPLRYGVGLEAQNCPNALNCPNFPNAELYPDEIYNKTIIYRFITK